MENFMEISDARTIPVSEYLESVTDPLRRAAIASVFEQARSALELMFVRFSVDVPVPEIFVLTTDQIKAEANPLGLIVVSQGMIKHCFDTAIPSSKVKAGNEDYLDGLPDLFPQIGLTWVLAHEYAHLFRAHHQVQIELGSHDHVLRAFEHDADLCAAAAVYRAVQQWLPGIQDIDIRCYVIYALFWIIRTFPNTNDGAGVHPSFSERFFQILLKLTTLQAMPGDVLDLDVKLSATANRGDALRNVAIACETAYLAKAPGTKNDFFMQWHEYFKSYGHIAIINEWIMVSPFVEKHSHTTADMRRHASVVPMTMSDIARLEKAERKRHRRAQARSRTQ